MRCMNRRCESKVSRKKRLRSPEGSRQRRTLHGCVPATLEYTTHARDYPPPMFSRFRTTVPCVEHNSLATASVIGGRSCLASQGCLL